MKWTIYDRNGKPKHESLTEYNSDGRIVYQDTFEYIGKWMGECYLTVSIKSPYPIDFQIGDYIEYRGEKFTINYDPTVIKKARRGTYGEGFVYDSIKFNSYSNELTMMMFHDWVLSDNKLHYTSLPTFSFYAKDVDDLVDRLQACADRWCRDNGRKRDEYWLFYTLANNTGGTEDRGQYQTTYERTVQRARDILEKCGDIDASGVVSTDGQTFLSDVQKEWTDTYGSGDSYKDSRDDERYDRNISVSSITVWDALQKIKTEFGLNFVIRGRKVYVGTVGISTAHMFEYGKGNGLYEVDKTADSSQKVVTRLHAYGSNQNLPTRYYADLNTEAYADVASVIENNKETDLHCRFELNLDYQSRYFTESLTKYGDGIYAVKISIDGITVNARAYNQPDGAHILIYSECYAEATDADDNTDAETFGKFQNALSTGKRVIFVSGTKRDAWPASNIAASTKNLPDNMAINSLMLPGFPNHALSELCRSAYDSEKGVTNYYITNPDTGTEVLFHTETGQHLVTFSTDRHDPFIVSQNASVIGYMDGDISCTESNDDNGLEAVYPTIEKTTAADAGLTGANRLDEVVSADKIEDNGVFDKEGTTIPGFHIIIPDLGFDLRQAAKDAGNGEFHISMKDGFCGGRTFSVTNCTQKPDKTWELNVKRVYDDSLDLYFPYSYAKAVKETGTDMTNAYQILKGDRFILTDISVSAVNYIWAASVKLLRKAIHWLCKNDYTRYVYSPKIDEIFMARQDRDAKADTTGKTKSIHDTIKEGGTLLFKDSDLLIDGAVHIDQLSIKENGNNGIPTYEVTLKDEVTVGTIQRIQNKVDSISNDIRSGNVGGVVSPTQVDPLIKAYGEKYFLSKTHDDTTEHKLTMGEAEVKGDTLLHRTKVDGALRVLQDIISDTMHSRSYSDDINGNGWHIWLTDGNTSHMTIDNLTVRGRWTAAVLDVMKLTYSAGNITVDGAGAKLWDVAAYDGEGKQIGQAVLVSSLNKTGGTLIKEVDAVLSDEGTVEGTETVKFYRCYFRASDGEKHILNEWRIGDYARCQTFNLTDKNYSSTPTYVKITNTTRGQVYYTSNSNRLYQRAVINVSSGPVFRKGQWCHFIDLANESEVVFSNDESGTKYAGFLDGYNDAPLAEDEIAHVGSAIDKTRQGAVQLVAVGEEGPAVCIYGGITKPSLSLREFLRIRWSPERSLLNTKYFKFTDGSVEQQPTLFCGIFEPGKSHAYPYEIWQYNGSSWLCLIETTSAPSEGPNWTAYASKGADGADGRDGTSFNVKGTAVGYVLASGLAGSTKSSDCSDYFKGIGYTPVSGDKCLYNYLLMNSGCCIMEYNGTAWNESDDTLGNGDYWLIHNSLSEYDGHFFVYENKVMLQGHKIYWRDLGSIKGDDGWSVGAVPSTVIINETVSVGSDGEPMYGYDSSVEVKFKVLRGTENVAYTVEAVKASSSDFSLSPESDSVTVNASINGSTGTHYSFLATLKADGMNFTVNVPVIINRTGHIVQQAVGDMWVSQASSTVNRILNGKVDTEDFDSWIKQTSKDITAVAAQSDEDHTTLSKFTMTPESIEQRVNETYTKLTDGRFEINGNTIVDGDVTLNGRFNGVLRRGCLRITNVNSKDYIKTFVDIQGTKPYGILQLEKAGSYVVLDKDLQIMHEQDSTDTDIDGITVVLPCIDGSYDADTWKDNNPDTSAYSNDFQGYCDYVRTFVGMKFMLYNYSKYTVKFSATTVSVKAAVDSNGLIIPMDEKEQEIPQGGWAQFECVATEGLYDKGTQEAIVWTCNKGDWMSSEDSGNLLKVVKIIN